MSRSRVFNSPYALIGAFTALGRPGIELWPCYFLGLGALFFGVVRAESHAVAAIRTLYFGGALGAVLAVGGVSWGVPVPLGIEFAVLGAVIVPLGTIARLASRWFEPGVAALFVGCAWSVAGFGFASAGLPCYMAASAALPVSGTLLGGARLMGAALVEGALVAACFGAAQRLAVGSLRARSTWLAALRDASLPVGALVVATLLARANAKPAERSLRVGVAQVNADSSFYESRMQSPEIVAAFDAQLDGLLEGLRQTDLVTLPEAFDGRYGLLLPSLVERWSELARTRRQAVLVTSYLPEATGQKSNAAGVFDRSGRLVGVHRKVVLAPYGERELAAGDEYETFEILPSVRVGILICQESMDGRAVSDLVHGGASLLVATTSDLTFGSSVLSFEHLAATRLRAMEAGRSIVWASNGGPSGVIDRFGGVDRLGPFRQAVAVRVDVELFEGTTPYLRLRWIWLSFQVLGLLACVAYARRGRTDAAPLPAPVADARAGSRWRGITAVAVSLVLAGLFVITSPAIVEWRKGSSARALLAIPDLFARKPNYRAPDPLAGFRGTDPERAAVAYLLGYYGDVRLAAELPPAPAPGLSGAGRLLRERFELETRAFDFSARLPRIAALVELKDGSVGVVASPSAEAAWLFYPKLGRLFEDDPEAIRALLGDESLLPALRVRGAP